MNSANFCAVRPLRIGRLASAFVLATLMAASLRATILEKIEFDRLCQTAERIVVATCTGGQAAWDKKHQTILTTYGFTVSQALKGQASPTVDVVTLGGIVGTEGMNVAGAPRFRAGEQYVLFLERQTDGALRCLGWTQGRYEIVTDPATGTKTVQGDTSGAAMIQKGVGKIEEGGPGKRMTLSTFLDSVQRTAGKGGTK